VATIGGRAGQTEKGPGADLGGGIGARAGHAGVAGAWEGVDWGALAPPFEMGPSQMTLSIYRGWRWFSIRIIAYLWQTAGRQGMTLELAPSGSQG
jgi:hypothetical protein